MGRPRTPKALLKNLKGVKKNPKRARERECEAESPGKIGKPPAEFLLEPHESGYLRSLRLRKIWREYARDVEWLDRANRMVLKSLCLATDAVNEAAKFSSKSLPQLLDQQLKLLNALGIPQANRVKALRDGDGGPDSGSVRMNLEIDL